MLEDRRTKDGITSLPTLTGSPHLLLSVSVQQAVGHSYEVSFLHNPHPEQNASHHHTLSESLPRTSIHLSDTLEPTHHYHGLRRWIANDLSSH
jgi:hypothetical protein